jgi:hypothetical protein
MSKKKKKNQKEINEMIEERYKMICWQHSNKKIKENMMGSTNSGWAPRNPIDRFITTKMQDNSVIKS